MDAPVGDWADVLRELPVRVGDWMQRLDGEDEGAEEDGASRRRTTGYSLPFDVAHRFAQPLGIHLDDWEKRVIDTQKDVVRLMPVTERGKQLLGESGAGAKVDEIELSATSSLQLSLFPKTPPTIRGWARRRGRPAAASYGEIDAPLGATTPDRVHAAMLFQASGRTEVLRAHLRAEQEHSPDFLRLTNAFTALYPCGSEEKRLLDAMLLATPR